MGNTAESLDLSIPKSLTLNIVSGNCGASVGLSFRERSDISFGADVESALASLLVKSDLPFQGSPKEAASEVVTFKRLGSIPVEIVYHNVLDVA